ncbi:Protein of unknown function [Lactobacillus helveticus CIRM-BIA 104]|uniref:Uncharacterized protein n=1 Tax=Lactobacillus helveticus CIRM-BIA 104 TaxID=1226333 RepID=U6FAL2_LACHE|nr:Protein of unknown function [Lactobacillus helveticus CIRM-BIA 104]CDI62459.1 Protein of unknown function [Lactobacillus helveticus CIRM-BIA 103]
MIYNINYNITFGSLTITFCPGTYAPLLSTVMPFLSAT